MSQQSRKPDVGLGYKSSYKDKNGTQQTYLSVMIREEQLLELTPENGVYKLSIFPNLGEKKNPKAPDCLHQHRQMLAHVYQCRLL